MIKKIEKIVSFLTVFALLSLLALMMMPDMTRSADTAVSATVADIYTCSTPAVTAAFGSIDNTLVYTADNWTTTTITANVVTYLKVNDAGDTTNPGLYKSSATTDLIGSADSAYANSATLVAGTEGYGLRAATTTAGSGNTLNLSFRYGTTNQTVAANYVGGFELTAGAVAIASTTAGVTTSREVSVSYKAAVSASNVAGSYSDTVTYTCTTTP